MTDLSVLRSLRDFFHYYQVSSRFLRAAFRDSVFLSVFAMFVWYHDASALCLAANRDQLRRVNNVR